MDTVSRGTAMVRERCSVYANRYKTIWSLRRFRLALSGAVLLFLASIVANAFAGAYATEKASNSVSDIILSNTRVYDVDGAFVYGVLALVVFILILLFTHPKRIPFVLYSLGLFFFIRSIFMTLTHLALYPVHAIPDFQNSFILMLFGGSDQFFSGHTGTPFLMALLFWNEKWLRYIFILWSIFFGVVVLLGHLHYSIDVFAAFFITYGIYHIALKFFPKEYAMFMRDEAAYPAK